MRVPELSDGDERYLERVAEDCSRVLGRGVELERIELGTNAETVLRVDYRLGDVHWSSEGRGASVIEAHAALREALVGDRLRLGFVALTRRA